jgi:hypothetical protein
MNPMERSMEKEAPMKTTLPISDTKRFGFNPIPIKHRPRKVTFIYHDYVLWLKGEEFVKLPVPSYVRERWM